MVTNLDNRNVRQYSSVPAAQLRCMVRWATVAALLAIVVIMLGAWTRLMHAGLGCPDWPGCYGFLSVPESDAHIAIANARFPGSPVDVAKGWPEMIHRYAAGILGVIVFGLAAYALHYRKSGVPVRLPLFVAAFIVLQGAFGMWTVTLKLWPQVVAMHLLGGFTTLSLLVLLALRLRGRLKCQQQSPLQQALGAFRPWLYGGLLLVILQIGLGAWTTANYAALACTELPTCQGQWWPQGMDFQHGFDITQQVGPNYLGGQLAASGRVAIHVMHRLGAMTVLGYFVILLLLMWRRRQTSGLARPIVLVAFMLVVQIALGLSNIIFSVPIAVAVAHNAMGAGLLVSVVHLIWQHHQRPLAHHAVASNTKIINREITV